MLFSPSQLETPFERLDLVLPASIYDGAIKLSEEKSGSISSILKSVTPAEFMQHLFCPRAVARPRVIDSRHKPLDEESMEDILRDGVKLTDVAKHLYVSFRGDGSKEKDRGAPLAFFVNRIPSVQHVAEEKLSPKKPGTW